MENKKKEIKKMSIARRKKKRGKGRISLSTAAAEAHKKVMKRTKPGTGKRFASMVKVLKAKGAKNPKALAAWIGRKKYGKKRFQSMAAKARKKKNRRRK